MKRETIAAMKPVLLWVAASLLLAGAVRSQSSAIKVECQRAAALLPGGVSNVSVVDGKVYCYASGVLLVAQRSREQLMGFSADTEFVKLADGIRYVVRQPGSGDLYFTCVDKKGQSWLYCSPNRDGVHKKARKVKLDGMTVEHPTFSGDGQILIFASKDGKRSLGGYDLWYAMKEKDKWGHPRNLGDRINTAGDEVSPAMYGECVVFASDGHGKEPRQMDLYAVRLLTQATGDTVGETLIGRSRVQRLPAPINGAATRDCDLAADSAQQCGYWVVGPADGTQTPRLYTYYGGLDGVTVWGRVVDGQGHEMGGVRVAAMQGGEEACFGETAADGTYQLFLRGDCRYDLSFRKEGYFVKTAHIDTQREAGDNLIGEQRLDAVLGSLAHGENITYKDLFGPGAEIELSPAGKERLSTLVRYLADNPHTRARLTLVSDLTTDAAFNLMLTSRRLQTLEEYLYAQLPTSAEVEFVNGCGGAEGCRNGSGEAVLTVLLESGK